MLGRQGFDEVTNVLLEHSFRYFGPTSRITRLINDNKDWNPTILPENNSLINLVDSNLRENNDAYLSFIYIMNYYIFDNFHTRLSYEIKNPPKSIDPTQLKFSEEELRKVMGNIGYLLLKEPALLESEHYDYLALYFQIKKLWSVIITKRYLEEEMFSLEEIKNKIKKSFAIAQLMKIDKAKNTIENFLISFDELYKDKETVEKHIRDFFQDYLQRYFSYIKLGLAPFIRDFCSIINHKFTSIDLLKENLSTLNPIDPFHKLLIDYLAEESNNLQTELEMEKFITLITDKLNEFFPVDQNSNNNYPEHLANDSLTDLDEILTGQQPADSELNPVADLFDLNGTMPISNNPIESDENQANNFVNDAVTEQMQICEVRRLDDPSNGNNLSVFNETEMGADETQVDNFVNGVLKLPIPESEDSQPAVLLNLPSSDSIIKEPTLNSLAFDYTPSTDQYVSKFDRLFPRKSNSTVDEPKSPELANKISKTPQRKKGRKPKIVNEINDQKDAEDEEQLTIQKKGKESKAKNRMNSSRSSDKKTEMNRKRKSSTSSLEKVDEKLEKSRRDLRSKKRISINDENRTDINRNELSETDLMNGSGKSDQLTSEQIQKIIENQPKILFQENGVVAHDGQKVQIYC